ncbi:MAG: DoxX family protein [Proteobacteria bacterium]|nr:DoxX family protein [Pseudomonadota bacterium]
MTRTKDMGYGALIARLALGSILLAHGLLKLFVFTVPGTVGYFESIGLPALAAYMTIFGELVGGTAIILGLYTRLAALLSLPILLGAVGVHAGYGWVFSNQGGGWEFPLLLVILAISVAFQGNGLFALRKLPIIDDIIPSVLKA